MRTRHFGSAALLLLACLSAGAEQRPRARDIGVPFDGVPGTHNAITDVAGVEVGHTTLIEGDGPLVRGQGPVRTGVTAILPRGKASTTPVFAAWATSNAAGEMTGTVWLEERDYLDGPVMITNTHSVGVVRDAVVEWLVEHNWPGDWFTPLVAETYDGFLNDTSGFHVTRQHAWQALAAARSGPVPEGNVGGGTGMQCSEFKGGIGTSSRRVEVTGATFMVGALVQCNYGARERLRISVAPVGRELADKYLPCVATVAANNNNISAVPPCVPMKSAEQRRGRDGSIIVVLATDAPLLPHQLKRLAKRPTLAMGRLGDIGGERSGDIFVAFSMANPHLHSEQDAVIDVAAFPNPLLTRLFEAAVQATEEAIVNSMIAAETMTGRDGHTLYALPHAELRRILSRYRVIGSSSLSEQ